jgi:hypothetical protein
MEGILRRCPEYPQIETCLENFEREFLVENHATLVQAPVWWLASLFLLFCIEF